MWSAVSILLCWFFDVDGSSSDLDDFLFLSLPPMYFHPVIHKASCFALTLNSSCNFHCVKPIPKKFMILNANVAASRRNGLFGFSFFMNLDSAFGTIVILTLSPRSSGTPCGLASWPTCSMNLGNALICTIGLTQAFSSVNSCLELSVCDSTPISPHALPILSYAVSNVSKSSVISSLSLSDKIYSSGKDLLTLLLLGITSSNSASVSSVCGQIAKHVGSLVALRTSSTSASFICGITTDITFLISSMASFQYIFDLPALYFSLHVEHGFS